MFECLIMGDSIAAGIAQYRREDCRSTTVIGINSASFYNRFKHFYGMKTKTAVISLGSNDRGHDTEANLTAIREQIQAERVIWILPYVRTFPDQHRAAGKVAAKFGDKIIDFTSISPDRVHPTDAGYRRLADMTK